MTNKKDKQKTNSTHNNIETKDYATDFQKLGGYHVIKKNKQILSTSGTRRFAHVSIYPLISLIR